MSKLLIILKVIERNEGFLFGSRTLEVATKNSDWDYFITEKNFEIIREKLENISDFFCDIGQKYDDYSFKNGFIRGVEFTIYADKICLTNSIIHVIPVPEKELPIWKMTTKMMQMIPLKYIKNADFRKKIYLLVLNVLKKEFNKCFK